MGNKCCVDRKDGNTIAKTAKERKSTSAFNDTKNRAISIGYHSVGADAAKFDKAYETNDIKTFVELMSSNQMIEGFETRMHPWAEDPRTVGCLACTQIAIIVTNAKDQEMAEGKNKKHPKDEVRAAGGIKRFVEYLDSDQEDRVQMAAIGLSFLVDGCRENAIEAYDAGAVDKLVRQLLNSKVSAVRTTAALTCRHICVENDKYKKKFFDLGGMKGLSALLAVKPDPSLVLHDAQLEAVLNLQDMIEDAEANIVTEYAKLAIAEGCEANLKPLTKSTDEEVAVAAQDVFEALLGEKKKL